MKCCRSETSNAPCCPTRPDVKLSKILPARLETPSSCSHSSSTCETSAQKIEGLELDAATYLDRRTADVLYTHRPPLNRAKPFFQVFQNAMSRITELCWNNALRLLSLSNGRRIFILVMHDRLHLGSLIDPELGTFLRSDTLVILTGALGGRDRSSRREQQQKCSQRWRGEG